MGPTADAVKEQAAPTAQAVKQQAGPAAEAVQSQAQQIAPDPPVQPGAPPDSLVGPAQSAGQHNTKLLFGTAAQAAHITRVLGLHRQDSRTCHK